MQSETKYTKQDLETMRAWSLQRKIQVTQTRIIEWIGRYDWNVYICPYSTLAALRKNWKIINNEKTPGGEPGRNEAGYERGYFDPR